MYCSLACRNKDEVTLTANSYKGNLAQWKKKGPNKLELAGRAVLKKQHIKFNEQILMFGKFSVDVLVKDLPLIIQWDGEYWHSKPKRKAIDRSQDAYLAKCGYVVLRFTDHQVYKETEHVTSHIKSTIQQLTAASAGIR